MQLMFANFGIILALLLPNQIADTPLRREEAAWKARPGLRRHFYKAQQMFVSI